MKREVAWRADNRNCAVLEDVSGATENKSASLHVIVSLNSRAFDKTAAFDWSRDMTLWVSLPNRCVKSWNSTLFYSTPEQQSLQKLRALDSWLIFWKTVFCLSFMVSSTNLFQNLVRYNPLCQKGRLLRRWAMMTTSISMIFAKLHDFRANDEKRQKIKAVG